MKVISIRRGHPTNSSSSHSVVFNDGTIVKDNIDGGEFGWCDFDCMSREAKLLYLVTPLLIHIHGKFEANNAPTGNSLSSWTQVRHFIEEAFPEVVGTAVWAEYSKNIKHAYIDHESYPAIYLTDDRLIPSVVRKVLTPLPVITNTNLVIKGGNDNDDCAAEGYVHFSDTWGKALLRPIDDLFNALGGDEEWYD